MREIKYRLVDKITHKVVDDDMQIYFLENEGCGSFKDAQEYFDFYQYTGLKDSKGKEIYEGDVVEVSYGTNADGLYEVKWDELGWYPLQYTWDYDDIHMDTHHWEVKGNIYENPELLGEGQE